jgi:excinuclease ABC subunit A
MQIELRGVSTHNLKNIDLDIPQRALVVITGVSGSGKSSLAFETLYAEGQRRFVESMSTYARQFLQRMEKPPLRSIRNVLPAIAMRQKHVSTHARSTVGTLTELDDHLQMLYARLGVQACMRCGQPVSAGSADSVAARLRALGEGARLVITAPIAVEAPETTAQVLTRLTAEGYQRLWWGGEAKEMGELDAGALLGATELDVLVDRVIIRADAAARTLEAVEAALRLGRGCVRVWHLGGGVGAGGGVKGDAPLVFREGLVCDACGTAHAGLMPSLFNPNTTLGACPVCTGFGRTAGVDYDKVIPSPYRSLAQDAVVAFATPARVKDRAKLMDLCERYQIDTQAPWGSLSEEAKRLVLHGDKKWGGVRGFFRALEGKRQKQSARIMLARFRGYATCDGCEGARVGAQARAVTVGGVTIDRVQRMTTAQALAHVEALPGLLGAEVAAAARTLLEEVTLRLRYMNHVGLGYLRLDRQTRTLSGGEFQRMHLTSSIGRSLSDTLYVLDEPTAGLHARDSERLLVALKGLRDQGNTVVVVEHDPALIEGADWIIELGPMGGDQGGYLLYVGALEGLLASQTPTGRMLSRGRDPAAAAAAAVAVTGHMVTKAAAKAAKPAKAPKGRAAGIGPASLAKAHVEKQAETQPEALAEAPPQSAPPAPRARGALRVVGAVEHNLQNLTVEIPLGVLVAVTGVSGSGKSTLVHDILYQTWCARAGEPHASPGRVDAVEGFELIEDVVMMTQNALGRSSRSNAATSTKAFDAIRKCFSSSPDAEAAGITPGHFSFNTAGGRCETCEGTGVVTVEMQFMADIELTCDACQGRRFQPQVLAIQYKGLSIDQVLGLTVEDATRFFADRKTITQKLQPLIDVGLGYLRLGQSTSTLSGGELQRLKLAAYLPAGSRNKAKRGASSPDDGPDTDGPDSARAVTGARPHLFIFDEPTTGLHLQDITVLLRALRRLVEEGHSVLVVEHNVDLIIACDHILDLGPEGGDGGGLLIASGPPAVIAQNSASYTGLALRALYEISQRQQNKN